MNLNFCANCARFCKSGHIYIYIHYIYIYIYIYIYYMQSSCSLYRVGVGAMRHNHIFSITPYGTTCFAS